MKPETVKIILLALVFLSIMSMQIATSSSIRNINYSTVPILDRYLIIDGNIIDIDSTGTISHWFTKDTDKPEDKQRWVFVAIGAKPFKEQK